MSIPMPSVGFSLLIYQDFSYCHNLPLSIICLPFKFMDSLTIKVFNGTCEVKYATFVSYVSISRSTVRVVPFVSCCSSCSYRNWERAGCTSWTIEIWHPTRSLSEQIEIPWLKFRAIFWPMYTKYSLQGERNQNTFPDCQNWIWQGHGRNPQNDWPLIFLRVVNLPIPLTQPKHKLSGPTWISRNRSQDLWCRIPFRLRFQEKVKGDWLAGSTS